MRPRPEWRLDQLARIERMLENHADEFCAALRQDFGKPPFEQMFEIAVPKTPPSPRWRRATRWS